MGIIKEINSSDVLDFALKYFPNFKVLENPFEKVYAYFIDDDIIGLINKYKFLQSLTLNHCNFATQKPLDSNIKCLIMTYSDLQNYYNCFNTLKQLKKLIIVESKSVDIAELCKLDKLITINIYNSNIKNSLLLNSFKSLKEFSYDGSVIDNLQIIENLRKDISVHYSEKYIFLN